MKNILISVLFLFIPKFCISQVTHNDYVVYLDSLYNIGTEKNYKYIQIIKDSKILNKESYEVKDFYKSGKIAMSGATTTEIGITRTGMFVYFYENGNRKSIANYRQNKPYGTDYELYEDGNKKLIGEWIDVKKKNTAELKINQFWNSKNIQTVIDGNGDYEENEDNFFASGKVKNGFKDGLWKGYGKKTEYTFSENYENGEFISGVSIDSNKVEHKYNVLEIHPAPNKGMDNFYMHIAKTFRTPNIQGLGGKIYLTFIVETDGSVKDIVVLKDLGYGTGEEAAKAILSYKYWLPGEQRGIKVRCTFSIPIIVHASN